MLVHFRVRRIPHVISYQENVGLSFGRSVSHVYQHLDEMGTIHQHCGTPLRELNQSIIYQAIEFLHDMEIIELCHGDIIPEYLLVNNGKLIVVGLEGVCYDGSPLKYYTEQYLLDRSAHTLRNDRFAMWRSLITIGLRRVGVECETHNPRNPLDIKRLKNLFDVHYPKLKHMMNQLYRGDSYAKILARYHYLLRRSSSTTRNILGLRKIPEDKMTPEMIRLRHRAITAFRDSLSHKKFIDDEYLEALENFTEENWIACLKDSVDQLTD
jgi:hypothetical protein